MKWLNLYKAILTLAMFFLAINSYAADELPQALEVIGKVGQSINSRNLEAICKTQRIPASDLYQWNNHLVVYGLLSNVSELKKQVAARYQGCEIKLYEKPFYNFTRSERCGKNGLAKQWDNIILTANLVANPKMQQEYLNYHKTQFQKWPQVSQGFCNASFQQLLVFKNGRQLMLIISIPHGESLDKLNPLTTKNNPKVDEWNNIMAKYQEGISGTKKGETWVFFKLVNKI